MSLHKAVRYRIAEIVLPLNGDSETLLSAAARRLGVPRGAVKELKLCKKSVDARKKDNVHFICTVEVDCDAEAHPRDAKVTPAKPYVYEIPVSKKLPVRPVVVGLGPAGLFAALLLAQAGQCPVVFERGEDVDTRTEKVEKFWRTGELDTESNVQFGEGGAGAFSDGKLNTGTKDTRARKVLEELAAHGAPEEILYDAKPHVGTDRLPLTVKAIREKICRLGGEVRFCTAVTGLRLHGGAVTGLEVTPQGGAPYQWEADQVVLAVGHSARDIFSLLDSLGLPMEAKPFAVGARIEHPQDAVNRAQYGRFAGHPALGAADYKLAVHLPGGRGVYTFCMCPGGQVVAAASEAGRLVTNGMSRFARDGVNANSALLVGVTPEDFGAEGALAGVAFQRRLEEAAFRLGGESYRAPAQRVEDFLQHRPSKSLGSVEASYRPGVEPAGLDGCLPGFLTDSMREGIVRMNCFLHGFSAPDAVLTAVESRSSSPVRILRGEDFQSPCAKGLYPCGEGAGYAGGIVSAAVDGLKCAEAILRRF